MASITYDGQSFMIDGRRIWLVSAAIHYARTPHQLWRQRIRAAKQAGFNCIETYVFWNLHEPQPGVFRWEGDADLRRFVQLIAEEGMWCILRPGPYVCAEWDFGGLPAWLHQIEDIKLRQSDGAFLQACGRYLAAVMDQVGRLQATRGGPIVIVQNENEWFCSNDEQGERYCQELNRHLREGGCKVPIINCNNLWQQVSGTINCWNGWDHLLHDCRQLRIAQPDAPRLVTELWPGWFDTWGREHEPAKSADDVLRRLVEVAATGAMFNLYMFHGGTNFGFWAGRSSVDSDRYITTSYDYDAPLTEAGGRTGKYKLVKRFATFLSQFAPLMAHLRPGDQHTVAITGSSVIQQSGTQGSAVFITQDAARPRAKSIDVLTPIGQTLRVHFGDSSTAWLVLDAKLGGVATLDLTNLRPLAWVADRMLVLFGPAGTEGVIGVDGSLLGCRVPKGDKPLVMQHEEVTIVVLNEKQADAAYLHEDGPLYVGIGGFDEQGEPIRDNGAARYTIVQPDGTTESAASPAPIKSASPPRLDGWQQVTLDDYTTGVSPRFAAIDGPQSLEASGADYGYGWYRVRFRLPRSRRVSLLMPEANDRLHLYIDGKLRRVIGYGPGAAEGPIPLSLSAGAHELILLADNLGRFNVGPQFGELKGLFGHLHDVKARRLAKVDPIVEPRVDPFELSGFIPNQRRDDRSPRRQYTWSISRTQRVPLIVSMHGERPAGVLLVNKKPVAIDGGQQMTAHFVLHPTQQLRRGVNTLTLALLDAGPDRYDPRSHMTVYNVSRVLTDGADWWYARWQMPDESAFGPLSTDAAATPTWYRTTFRIADTHQPLWLEASGLSKGQIYLNGHNVGRYFVATHTGAKVPPQKRYYLPEPWLNTDADNELVLFDEHGKRPTRCKLVHDPLGPYGART